MKFLDLGVDRWLLKNLQYLNYTTPTEIQLKGIPKILSGENFVGISNTGTGKTAAFNLPLLTNLAKDPVGVFALILEPTRELAFQVLEQLKVMSSGFNLRINLIIGGDDVTTQLCSMDKIPHIIVATPGRLNYLIRESNHSFKSLDKLRYLILDEFDQLLNDSILPDIKEIIEQIPSTFQTLFLSATINYNIHTKEFFDDLCKDKRGISDIVDLTIGDTQEKTVQELTQKYVLIPNKIKELYLFYLLSNNFKKKYTIIFVSSCLKCHYISQLLELLGFKVSMIHSKIPQKLRFKAIEDFKSRKTQILISTDVASRGLDIPLVDLVINYDIPRNPDDYVHRVGRTARAGNFGVAVCLVTQYDVSLLLEIEKTINKKLAEISLDDEEVIKELSYVSNASKEVKIKIFESGIEEKINEKKQKNISRKNKKINQN